MSTSRGGNKNLMFIFIIMVVNLYSIDYIIDDFVNIFRFLVVTKVKSNPVFTSNIMLMETAETRLIKGFIMKHTKQHSNYSRAISKITQTNYPCFDLKNKNPILIKVITFFLHFKQVAYQLDTKIEGRIQLKM